MTPSPALAPHREGIVSKLMIGVIGGLIAGVGTWFIITHVERERQAQLTQARERIQGFWVVRTKTAQSAKTDYVGMTIDHFLILTVDSNFNIQGVGYKCREESRRGKIDYPREARARSTVSGSFVSNHALLNWESVDASGRQSIQTFDGSASNVGGRVRVSGSFINEVAGQSGRFCAEKVVLDALVTDTFPSLNCQP